MKIAPAWCFAEISLELRTFGLVSLTVGIFGFGAYLIWRAKQWRDSIRHAPDSEEPTVDHFRQLAEDGEISEDEFAKIQARLEQGPLSTDMPAHPMPNSGSDQIVDPNTLWGIRPPNNNG